METEPNDKRRYSALIIDDNWFNRDIFRIALESCSYHVTQADDGVKGSDLLAKEAFDLLILDLLMPNMDGGSLLKTVRLNKAYDKLQVVVVTANAHMVTQEIQELANYVMYKPVNLQAFAQLAIRLRDAAS